MAWRVEDSYLLAVGVEVGTTNFDSLALSLFFLAIVHDIGEPPRVTTLVFGFLAVFCDFTLINHAHLKHNLTGDGRLTSINVTNENESARLLFHVDTDEGALINLNLFLFDHFGRNLLLDLLTLSFSSNLSFSFGFCCFFLRLVSTLLLFDIAEITIFLQKVVDDHFFLLDALIIII